MRAKTVVCTSVGLKRKINQDNFYINGVINNNTSDFFFRSFFASHKEQLLCICDGMGGEADGETAAFIAVKTLLKARQKYKTFFNEFEKNIASYVMSANNNLCKYIKEHDNRKIGSTVAAVCISPKSQGAIAANVGDSKVFLYRRSKLIKISEDHNEAQSLVSIGIISEEEARTHKDKSKLTQHLGMDSNELIIEPFISDNIILEKEDIFLLCSDGLTDMLSYKEIGDILKQNMSIKKVCKKLVDAANKHGGRDNITVILSKIT